MLQPKVSNVVRYD